MLRLQQISLHLDSFSLEDISLEVKQGEYFILLGESGAGKSLILEIIAGLIVPSNGSLWLKGMDISRKRIHDRNIGLVLQDYAVFPHLRVDENIAYALKGRCSSQEKKERTGRTAAKLGITHLLRRRPSTLSGGELQRVALARTLVLEPSILLLDEPLASLDRRLRHDLRRLLRMLHREGQTILHVTHDFEEAISLADTVAILHKGKIIQTGPPREVLSHPKNAFVAHFTGEANFFPAEVILKPEGPEVKIGIEETIRLEEEPSVTRGHLLIRKNALILSRGHGKPDSTNVFRGIIDEWIPFGNTIRVTVDVGVLLHAEITPESVQDSPFSPGEQVWISFNSSGIKFVAD